MLENALKRTLESGRPPRIFDQIFLCTPDVADDVFEPGRPFCELPGMAENVTVYHNKGDLAMPVSDYTKGNTDRLGWRGANRPADLDGRVHIVDCGGIVTGAVEHSYYQCGPGQRRHRPKPGRHQCRRQGAAPQPRTARLAERVAAAMIDGTGFEHTVATSEVLQIVSR